MPRIRSIKPEHKVHRKVGPLSDRAYRLWVGLLTEADDEGRLVGDLAQLRALVFPYQTRLALARLEAALRELLEAGLLTRYAVAGVPYLAFPSWEDHQQVSHARPSKVPSPTAPGSVPEVSGAIRKFPEPSGLARARGSDPIRSDPIRSDQGMDQGMDQGTSSAADAATAPWPSAEGLMALWNAEAPIVLPRVATLSAQRQGKARTLLGQFPAETFWRAALAEYAASGFLRGERNGPGHEGFRADFDWLLARNKDGIENLVRVHDGHFRDGDRPTLPARTRRNAAALAAFAREEAP